MVSIAPPTETASCADEGREGSGRLPPLVWSVELVEPLSGAPARPPSAAGAPSQTGSSWSRPPRPRSHRCAPTAPARPRHPRRRPPRSAAAAHGHEHGHGREGGSIVCVAAGTRRDAVRPGGVGRAGPVYPAAEHVVRRKLDGAERNDARHGRAEPAVEPVPPSGPGRVTAGWSASRLVRGVSPGSAIRPRALRLPDAEETADDARVHRALDGDARPSVPKRTAERVSGRTAWRELLVRASPGCEPQGDRHTRRRAGK